MGQWEVNWENRALVRNVQLRHKREVARLMLSQHRYEVEYMRYYKGDAQTTRDKRFCVYCLEVKKRQVVGDEKHVIETCPQFSGQRKTMFDKIRDIVKTQYGFGTTKQPYDTLWTYRKRKEQMKKEGYELNRQFQDISWDITWHDVWTANFADIPLSDEAHVHITAVVGAYVSEVNQTKTRAYEVKRERIKATGVHGDAVDALQIVSERQGHLE